MKTFIVQVENDVIDIITAQGLEKHFLEKLNLMTRVVELKEEDVTYIGIKQAYRALKLRDRE